MNRKQKKMLFRIIAAGVLLVVLNLVPVTGWARAVLFALPYLIIGYDILLKAAKGIAKGQLLDENFLMAVASLGAFAIAVADGKGDFNEAVAVMLFYQTGELFESVAVGKSRKSISALMDIRPDSASIIREDGSVEQVDPDEVPAGSLIQVDPGEKIPIDGHIEEGSGTLDTSALTGESLPREVFPGDEVISGSINLSGRLKVRTSREFGESTVSKILDLVENSSSRKSRSENFITGFARVYTPVVCSLALALAVLPPVISLIAGNAPMWGDWIYRALTFLVISCPCALVVSIPLGFFAGLGGASREGILIKGSNFLEALSKVDTVVFDKTGTLTKGSFEVAGIHHCPIDEKLLIELAAHAESPSSHPISKSIQRAYGYSIEQGRIRDVQEIPGQGICAVVDGKSIAAGNERLMAARGIAFHSCHSTGTIVHIGIDGEYAGHIVISDRVKDTSAAAVKGLKANGIRKTVMLTGDADKVGRAVAKELAIDEVYTELLPAGKVEKAEQLLSHQEKGHTLAFVGDGINDAPVLSRADIGIAMGGLGSDAAIEAADIVIMDDDPAKIPLAVRIARKCMGIVYTNIAFAIGVKVICMVLGALGIANMWLAVFADVGVLILCILNAIRALFVSKGNK